MLSAGSGGSSGSGPPPPAVGIRINPASASIPAAGTQQFTATVTGTSHTALTWSVNGDEGGSSLFGKISNSGPYFDGNDLGNSHHERIGNLRFARCGD